MAEPPLISGYYFGTSTKKVGYGTERSCVVFEPSYTEPASVLNPDDFDWTDIVAATQITDMVKERCLAATGDTPSLETPVSDSEKASLAATWALLQDSIVDAVSDVVPDAYNTSENDYQSWGEIAAGGGSSAFELFCEDAGLNTNGWGWAYATETDENGTPDIKRDSNTRSCTLDDLYGVKSMVADIKLALEKMKYVKIPFDWIGEGNNGTAGDGYYNDYDFDGTNAEIDVTSGRVALALTQTATAIPSTAPQAWIRITCNLVVTASSTVDQVIYESKTVAAFGRFDAPIAGSYNLHLFAGDPPDDGEDAVLFSGMGILDENAPGWDTVATGSAAAGEQVDTAVIAGGTIGLSHMSTALYPTNTGELSLSLNDVTGDANYIPDGLGSLTGTLTDTNPISVPVSIDSATCNSVDVAGNSRLTVDPDTGEANALVSITYTIYTIGSVVGSSTHTATAYLFKGEDYEIASASDQCNVSLLRAT